MADSSESSDRRRDRSPSPPREHASKLFVTNLDGRADIKELEDELRRMFEKCGEVDSVVAKRNRNSEYCFAFVEMKEQAAAMECVKEFDQSPMNGKSIKVEFQDDGKRRKDANKGCYNCGKMGHFARECHSSRVSDRDRDRGYSRRYSRSRSRSDSYERRKKKRRRHSYSSDRGRSRSPRSKKDRKRRSRDREEKHKKKHRRRDSSDS